MVSVYNHNYRIVGLMKQEQMLKILENNLANFQPQAVSSEELASQLCLPITETINLLKIMHHNGTIICDADWQHCIITREGLSRISEKLG